MLLTSPDPTQRTLTIAGFVFRRSPLGCFELPNEDQFCKPLLEAGWQPYVHVPKPGAVVVPDEVKSAEMFATVIRCTCDPARNPERFGPGGLVVHHGQPCPWGREQNLGCVASYYRNPFTRFLKRTARFFGKEI